MKTGIKLLKRIREWVDDPETAYGNRNQLLAEIDEYFAKPLPEPAAWINKNQLKFTTDIYEAQDWIIEGDHVVHYYAGPPARSPMPDVEISKAFCDESGVSIGDTIEDAFEAGVRFGEQYHGIKEQE